MKIVKKRVNRQISLLEFRLPCLLYYQLLLLDPKYLFYNETLTDSFGAHFRTRIIEKKSCRKNVSKSGLFFLI